MAAFYLKLKTEQDRKRNTTQWYDGRNETKDQALVDLDMWGSQLALISTTRQPSGELCLSQVHNTSSMFSSTWLHPRL